MLCRECDVAVLKEQRPIEGDEEVGKAENVPRWPCASLFWEARLKDVDDVMRARVESCDASRLWNIGSAKGRWEVNMRKAMWQLINAL